MNPLIPTTADVIGLIVFLGILASIIYVTVRVFRK